MISHICSYYLKSTTKDQRCNVFMCVQEYNQNSIFSQAYGKNLPPSSKPDAPMMHQEPSLYSLFEGTPWSPSLPASSGTSHL